MTTISHKNLTGNQLHEPKGVSSATLGTTYVADGAGSGSWQAVGFTTGDVKPTIKTVSDSGWVMLDDGTIGSSSSGATNRANSDTSDLYTLLWTNISDTYAAVTGGRGASASADFAANKPIALPKALGRVLGSAGAGSGLTSRALGFTVGEETHALTSGENGPHTHSITDNGHTHTANAGSLINAGSTNSGYYGGGGLGNATTLNNATTGITIDSSGSGTGHNNMQPSLFVNWMIKL